MTTPLTLIEIHNLIKEVSIDDAMQDDRISDFIEAVEKSGKDFLKENGGVEYVKAATSLLAASVISEFLEDDPMEAMAILSNYSFFLKVISICFIYSIGISIVEELH